LRRDGRIAPVQDEGHMRGPWTTLIGSHDDPKAAFGRELQRLLLWHSKLRSENVHGRSFRL
jgi:hypothetical protein